MLRPVDLYFIRQDEPIKSCMLFLRKLILEQDPSLEEAWKYSMPFYCFKGKMFCYLWVHKKFNLPYIGVVEGGKIDHPLLIQEKRARMKILLLDPKKDLPIDTIQDILQAALALYKK